MKRYLQSEFLHILLEEDEKKAVLCRKRLQTAYEIFISSMYEDSVSNTNIIFFFHRLTFTKTELSMIKEILSRKTDCTTCMELVQYIDKALAAIDSQLTVIEWEIHGYDVQKFKQENFPVGKFQWTRSVSDFVEFIYGLYETKSINDGDVDIKELMQFFCACLDFEVKNIYSTYREIRKRVGEERTHYLNEMAEKVNNRMDDVDNGVTKRKR